MPNKNEKLILPVNKKDIAKFFTEHEDKAKKPSFILEYMNKEPAYDSTQAAIIIGLLLNRLLGFDVEKLDVNNSDVLIQVGEYPVFYEGKKQKWLRDKRFPIITKELMEHIFSLITPEDTKSKITNKLTKLDREDLDEDFAINLEVNPNFDYKAFPKNNNIYYTKPQYIVQQNIQNKDLLLGRFRVNLAKQQGSKLFVLRKLEAEIPDFFDLKLNERFLQFLNYKEGLVLVTGPTGSGKSTTLAAMINEINKNMYKNIITIEDPVEFVHKNKNSIFSQREIGEDTFSFASGLRSALREKPDIIIIGELRDLETIRLAIEAAETGHLVFGTLHTFNAAKTVDRIINSFPKEEKQQIAQTLSTSLIGVISQTLVKTKAGGITALNEMIVATDGIRKGIADMDADKIIQAAGNNPKECLIMKEHGFQLIIKNIVSQGEVLSILYKKDKPTYELLVEKLKAAGKYDDRIDPYSDINEQKTKEALIKNTNDSNKEVQVEKGAKQSVSLNLG